MADVHDVPVNTDKNSKLTIDLWINVFASVDTHTVGNRSVATRKLLNRETIVVGKIRTKDHRA